jgi:hypothetical protein
MTWTDYLFCFCLVIFQVLAEGWLDEVRERRNARRHD